MGFLPKITPRHKLGLLLLDASLYFASVPLIYTLRLGDFRLEYYLSPGLWFILFCLLTFSYVLGSYDVDDLRGRQLIVRMGMVVFLTLSLVVVINYVFAKERMGLFGRGILIGSLVIYALIASFYRIWIRRYFKFQVSRSQWLILGDQKSEDWIKKDQISALLRGNYSFVRGDQKFSEDSLGKDLAAREVTGYVIAAESLDESWKKFLLDQKMNGEFILLWPDFIELVLRKIPVELVQMDWLYSNSGYKILAATWLVRVKRLHDLLLALIVFLLTWPLFILTLIGIKLDSGGPVLYQQKRTGLRGREFVIYKFRSMRLDAEKNGPQWASSSDQRITRFGHFMRKTRLDELPQLWNVFKGDMSFIGPRPERPEFNSDLEKQIPYYSLRHLVRPGLTGWAQILYPYGASVEDAKRKLEYDLYYIKNYSFVLDYLILLRTLKVIFFGQGR